jgi:hypothetical protein
MRKVISIDIEEEYWKEFKKLCVEENTSMAKKVEKFILNEANDYIVSQIKEKETEKETENETNKTEQKV